MSARRSGLGGNSIKFFKVVTVMAVACGLVGCGKEDSPPQPPPGGGVESVRVPDLDGAWIYRCSPMSLLDGRVRVDRSYRIVIRVQGSEILASYETFHGSRACSGPSAVIQTRGVLETAASWSDGTREGGYEIRQRVVSKIYTLNGEELAFRANEERECDLADWVSKVGREVNGLNCGREYDMTGFFPLGYFEVKGDRLYLGHRSAVTGAMQVSSGTMLRGVSSSESGK